MLKAENNINTVKKTMTNLINFIIISCVSGYGTKKRDRDEAIPPRRGLTSGPCPMKECGGAIDFCSLKIVGQREVFSPRRGTGFWLCP
jgi:hypothetical protein